MVHKERRATYRVAVLLGTLLLQPEQNVLGRKLWPELKEFPAQAWSALLDHHARTGRWW